MEDQRVFYESERNIFNDPEEIISEQYAVARNQQSLESCFYVGDSPPRETPIQPTANEPPYFRAYNPMDQLQFLPTPQRQRYEKMLGTHKTFNGIQHFFDLGQDTHVEEFLGDISSDAFQPPPEDYQLGKFFKCGEDQHHNDLEEVFKKLNYQIQEIHKRNLSSINIRRTVASSFSEHFQNFTSVFNSQSYASEFAKSLGALLASNQSKAGPHLILLLYDFWMRSFKEFVNQIWKHSSKFTINLLLEERKKTEHNIGSENQSQKCEREKRKCWSNDELSILQNCINNDMILTNAALKKLSEQLGRSETSVASKIQKLIKLKKDQQLPEESLLKRAIEILKLYPEGLTREAVVEKINENYEMGYGGQWEKSLGQILSNRKQFIKQRGKHRLRNPEEHLDRERSPKMSFKDKVIECLANCPDYAADLRTIGKIYFRMFEQGDDGELAEERRKSIEMNISKTLSRYTIFDNSQAKTLYLYNPEGREGSQDHEMEREFDAYFAL